MSRLGYILLLPIGVTVIGSLIIAAFTFGFYGWQTIALMAVLGAVLTVPICYLVARAIKRKDPGWDAANDRARHRMS